MASAVLKSLEEVLRGLECSICAHHYRKPKVLPCGHSLCAEPCLQQLIGHGNKVTCPECRLIHSVPARGTHAFPTNYTIQRLVEDGEKEPSTDKSKISSCALCNKRCPLVECHHCDLMICERCRVRHSRDLEVELRQLEKRVNECAVSGLQQQPELQQESTQVIDKQVEAAISSVELTTERCLTAIKTRKFEIIEEIQQFKKREISLIEHCSESANKSYNESSTFCDKTIEALDDPTAVHTHEDLIDIKQNLQNHLEIIKRSSRRNLAFHKLQINIGNDDIVPRAYDAFISVKDEVVAAADPNASTLAPCYLGSVADRELGNVLMHFSWKTHATGNFLYVEGLAVSPYNDDIVVGISPEVLLYNAEGIYKMTLGSTNSTDSTKLFSEKPGPIAVGQNGEIVIFERRFELHVNVVRIFSPQGEVLHSFNIYDDEHDDGSSIFTDLAIDPAGFIHACTFHGDIIHVWTRNGNLVRTYKPHNIHGYPEYIAINSQGSTAIVVSYYESGENGFAVLGLNDKLEKVGITVERDGCATGLTITEDNHIIVSDVWAHTIRIYTLCGKLLKVFGAMGNAVGQLFEPHGVAVSADGGILVSSNNGFVQKF